MLAREECGMIPIRERVNDVMIVSFISRTVIAILGGFVFGFVGWLIAWLLIPYLEFTGLALPIGSSVFLGLSTSIPATSIFWDAHRSPGVRMIYVVSVVGSAMLACIVTFVITMNNPKYTYLTRGVIFPMINIGTFISTLIAAGFYLQKGLFQVAE